MIHLMSTESISSGVENVIVILQSRHHVVRIQYGHLTITIE
jgi:hypothetical protein